MRKRAIAVKITVFAVLSALLVGGLTYVLKPVWTDWNNYNTIQGFYEEPEDTIETLFLGASTVISGITPMELYEDYGICAYNFATQAQPLMASYYLLEETYKYHSETLDTVVLDTSLLRRASAHTNFIKAFDNLRFSTLKYRAMYNSKKNMYEFFARVIPLLSYHDRWTDLTIEDFKKAGYEPDLYMRGYLFDTGMVYDQTDDVSGLYKPAYTVDTEESMELNAKELTHFYHLLQFCEEHDIQLVLMQTPTTDWSDEAHNAVQALADECGVDFLDFNYSPLLEDIDFNYPVDHLNGKHSNYYGAAKLTAYLGKYLVEVCGNRDVRGDERYAFMDEELADYHRDIISIDLGSITDPGDYLTYIEGQEDYVIFMAVCGDGAGKLTEGQREIFAGLGLEGLSGLEYGDAYLAVVDDGKVLCEQAESCAGVLDDGTDYSLASAGLDTGETASILIGGEEYAAGTRGINIVVYDKKLGQVADSAVFNTSSSSIRNAVNPEETLENKLADEESAATLSGKLRQLYYYNRLCEVKETLALAEQDDGDGAALTCLQTYMNNEEYDIFISVKGDAAGILTDEIRETLRDMGLHELADLEEGDSYLAVIKGGVISTEQRDHGESALQVDTASYRIISGGTESGNKSSIVIEGKEYANGAEGLNIVIYDNVAGTVAGSMIWD